VQLVADLPQPGGGFAVGSQAGDRRGVQLLDLDLDLDLLGEALADLAEADGAAPAVAGDELDVAATRGVA
jgi:hypothetical protein